MINLVALILTFLAFAVVVALPLPLPRLLAHDDLGYTYDPDPPEPEPPPDAGAFPVRFSGYTVRERRWSGVHQLLECCGHATYPCLHCGAWLWTEEGAKFHLLTEHGEELVYASQSG